MRKVSETNWEETQTRAFTKWMNSHLKKRSMKVENLITEIGSGVPLFVLYQEISGEKLGKMYENPQSKFHKIANLNMVIDRINQVVESMGIKLQFSAEQIFNGEKRQVLGLIWTLILRFQINKSALEVEQPKPTPKEVEPVKVDTTTEQATVTVTPVEPVKQNIPTKQQKPTKANAGDSAKQELLRWVQEKLKPYENEFVVKDFTHSWQDGKALSALISTLKPKALKYKKIDFVNTTPLEINTNAIRIAEEELDIPEIIDPEDITDAPEELSLMTYISYFRDYDNLHPEAAQEVDEEEAVVTEPAVTLVEEPTQIIVEDIIRPEIDPSKCVAEGPAFDANNPPAQGSRTFFTITTFDEEGNRYIPKSVDDDENQVIVNLFSPHMSEDETIPEPDIKNNGDGTYEVSFIVPVGVKDMKALIVINGGSIQNSPHDIPNATVFDPSKSLITGPGVEPYNLFVEEPTSFTIQCKDSNGNNIPQKGLKFDITLTDSSTGTKAPIDVTEVTDNGDGTYTVNYTPKCPGGSYELSVQTTNEEGVLVPVGNSPFDVTFEQKVCPTMCTARGNGILPFGLKTGVLTKFDVEIRDKAGNIIPFVTDADITVDLVLNDESIEPEDYSVKIENNQNGTFTVSYRPKRAGVHYILVKCNDENISQSPFKVDVTNIPSAPNSKLKFVSVKNLPNLVETELDLKVLDSLGKKALSKNCKLTALVEDEDGNLIPAMIVQTKDDKFKVVFQPKGKAAPLQKFKTQILMDGVPVGESVTVEHKPALAPKLCKVFGPGLNGADLLNKDTVPAMLKIKAFNTANQPFIQNNLQPVKASAKKLKRLAKTIFKEPEYFKDLLNPIFDHEYQDEVVDSIDLTKSVDLDEVRPQLEKHVKKQPFHVIVKNEKDDTEEPTLVFNTAPSEYTVFYHPTKAGPISITILDKTPQGTISPQPVVAESPYHTFVTEGIDPLKCQVKGPGLLKAYKNRPTYITLLPRDVHDYPCGVGGHEFSVMLCDESQTQPVHTPLTIVDLGNGNYDVKFNPPKAGKHFISVKCDGKEIKDSPIPIFVRDDQYAPDPKNCHVYKNPEKMKTTKPRHFFVQMKDKNNEPIKSGGDPLKAVLKTHDGKFVENLPVYDPNTGKYKVDLAPKRPGKYVVVCSLGDEDDGGEQISGSPFNLTVNPGFAPLNSEIGEWEYDIHTAQENEVEDLMVKVKTPSGKTIYPAITKYPKPVMLESDDGETSQPQEDEAAVDDEFSKGDRFKLSIQTKDVEKGII
ncbi:hypothetical protein C9374_012496 [Naegleria lovaniensis]|uniref:Calponin-homology (CH) domain-containing protein n=1 Tax=Naegleria lovaniensis TaxID=51637 RepID=A0AA88KQZ5_NAELO|nr:uncharacterized protein C9374_012496 [Naegleria lovaniensis]KAG2392244.1 hypothetical protein C9374_012496 [Naegleria lovaniensis]